MVPERRCQRNTVHRLRIAFLSSEIGLGGRASRERRRQRFHLDRQLSRGWFQELADRATDRWWRDLFAGRRIGQSRCQPRRGLPESGREPEKHKAGPQGLTRLESRGPRKKRGRFRKEISGRRRCSSKSHLLFYSLPADFQQVFTAIRGAGQHGLPVI